MSPPGPSQSKGIKAYIGTPAADFLTDTYLQFGSLNTVGEYGPEIGDVTFEDLSTGLVEHFDGPQDDGNITVGVGWVVDNPGQLAAKAAAKLPHKYNIKFEFSDLAPVAAKTVTISNATPGVVTWVAHGLKEGTAVKFTTTGALPTGLTAGTTYYVKTVLSVDTFSVSATRTLAVVNGEVVATAGAAIDTSSAGSGVHTGTTDPSPTVEYFKAKVSSFRRSPQGISGVTMANIILRTKAGSLVTFSRLPVPPDSVD